MSIAVTFLCFDNKRLGVQCGILRPVLNSKLVHGITAIIYSKLQPRAGSAEFTASDATFTSTVTSLEMET